MIMNCWIYYPAHAAGSSGGGNGGTALIDNGKPGPQVSPVSCQPLPWVLDPPPSSDRVHLRVIDPPLISPVLSVTWTTVSMRGVGL